MQTELKSHIYYKISDGISTYVPPLFMILGTLGNGLSVAVFTRKHMRKTATSIFLTALAIADLCVLYTDFIHQWFPRTFQFDITQNSGVGCKVGFFSLYFFTDLSGWILVAITFERVLLVWLPQDGKRICSRRSAMVAIVVLIFALAGINGHLLYGIGLNVVVNGNNTIVKKCDATDSDADYRYFFTIIWPLMDFTVYSVGPFILLVIGNSLIIGRLLYNRRTLRARMSGTATGENSATKKKRSGMMALLFLLNVVYFITTTPICIYVILFGDVNGGTGFEDVNERATMNLVWTIFAILMYANNTFNFVLYFINGETFRREAKSLICRKCTIKENTTKTDE